jgi:Family of unknown function (DUF5762)
MSSSFFADDINEFYKSNDIVPLKEMTLEEKFNCIGRLIVLVSIITFCFTLDLTALIGGVLAIFLLIMIYKLKDHKKKTSTDSFVNLNPKTLQKTLKTEFQQTKKTNPLTNVLLTEIVDNPNRKSAPPTFNIEVNREINNRTKEMIQDMNPTIENTNKQLFGDLGEMFEFEHSQRQFYATANTRVENNQTAFANWCYGDMPSAKENNPFALERNQPRYTLY